MIKMYVLMTYQMTRVDIKDYFLVEVSKPF